MKKNRQHDPFKNLILDDEEKLIEEALERGEFKKAPNFEATKSMLEEAARRHIELNTAKPITIRINQLDLIKVKAKAKKKQIPYQTLLGALIHQYAESDKDKKFEGKYFIDIVSPSGNIEKSVENDFDIPKSKKRMRTRLKVQGFLVKESGDYYFNIFYKDKKMAKKKKVTSLPVEVNLSIS